MSKEEAIAAFARGIHADLLGGYDSCEQLVRDLLTQLSDAERAALRAQLANALKRLTPSEMKGILNRANDEIRFNSKGAYNLLRAAADQLGLP